jgi:signal transduction histidine kinase
VEDARTAAGHGTASKRPDGLVGRFRRLSLLKKTMVANSAVVLLGAIAGTYLTRVLGSYASSLTLALLFFTCGAFVTIFVNYLAFWDHFRPLLELAKALEEIRSGREARQAIEGARASGEREGFASVLRLLDRIEDDSLQFPAKLFGSIESERKRIGRELHDDTSQILAAALVSIGLAERRLPEDAIAARLSLGSTKDLLQRALDQLKVVIYDLRPAMLDELGLAAAIRWYAKARVESQRPGVEVCLDFDVSERPPPIIETTVYRIAQEALANAVKHSGAKRIEVRLEVRPGFVALGVHDDGRGFDLVAARGQGLGLLSMRERVMMLDGQFNVVTEAGRGTRVYAVIPLPGSEPPQENPAP